MTTEDGRKEVPFEVAAVGLGIGGARQITREAEEVLKRCNEIMFIDSGYGAWTVARTLPTGDQSASAVRGRCPPVANLSEDGWRGGCRRA